MSLEMLMAFSSEDWKCLIPRNFKGTTRSFRPNHTCFSGAFFRFTFSPLEHYILLISLNQFYIEIKFLTYRYQYGTPQKYHFSSFAESRFWNSWETTKESFCREEVICFAALFGRNIVLSTTTTTSANSSNENITIRPKYMHRIPVITNANAYALRFWKLKRTVVCPGQEQQETYRRRRPPQRFGLCHHPSRKKKRRNFSKHQVLGEEGPFIPSRERKKSIKTVTTATA